MAHRRHVHRLVVAFALMPLALTSCLWLRDVDALSSGGAPDVDGSTAPDVTQEDGNAPTVDAAACPGDAGPAAVRIGAYCIDSTEVTVGDYRAFLLARAGDTSGQPGFCAGNELPPTQGGIPGPSDDAKPIVNVDYCDAIAFCAWAGKRLCGAIDGGTGRTDDYGSASASQWFRACSHNADGLHAWPYGNSYEGMTCNGVDAGIGVTLAVGSLPGCMGGYPGLFDMSGNVREWEDACDLGADADGSTCLVRGGAFYDNFGTLSCDNRQVMQMLATNPGVGFRCCSP